MKTRLKSATLALALSCAVGSAHAALIGPSQGPIPMPSPITWAGGTLLDSLISTISAPTFSGVARTAVYDGPEEGVNLDFYYQFSNNSGSAEAVERISATNFGNTVTNAFQLNGGFGGFVAGSNAATTVDRGPLGSIGFNFNTASRLLPGDSSHVLQIRTNATAFTGGHMGIIDGSAATAAAFQPVAAPIPEPETYAMLLAGLGLLTFVGKRRLTGSAPGRSTA